MMGWNHHPGGCCCGESNKPCNTCDCCKEKTAAAPKSDDDGGFLNEKPFEYDGRVVSFKAARCDFEGGVDVTYAVGALQGPVKKTVALIMGDVAAMIGYHATNIHPHLNGFRGYDGFEFVDPKVAE
jgi:hypothetical protein